MVEGEKTHAIHNLLDRLRHDMDDPVIVRSLPHRQQRAVLAVNRARADGKVILSAIPIWLD